MPLLGCLSQGSLCKLIKVRALNGSFYGTGCFRGFRTTHDISRNYKPILMEQTALDSPPCMVLFESLKIWKRHGGLGGKTRINNMIHHGEHEFTCTVLLPEFTNGFWRNKRHLTQNLLNFDICGSLVCFQKIDGECRQKNDWHIPTKCSWRRPCCLFSAKSAPSYAQWKDRKRPTSLVILTWILNVLHPNNLKGAFWSPPSQRIRLKIISFWNELHLMQQTFSAGER